MKVPEKAHANWGQSADNVYFQNKDASRETHLHSVDPS